MISLPTALIELSFLGKLALGPGMALSYFLSLDAKVAIVSSNINCFYILYSKTIFKLNICYIIVAFKCTSAGERKVIAPPPFHYEF